MRWRSAGQVALGWLAVLLGMAGCGVSPAPPAPMRPSGSGRTQLIHLPGMAGDSFADRWWINELRLGGAADRVELYDWTCNDTQIGALQAYARNHREAWKIARRIIECRASDPETHILLTATSAGTGPLVWSLENLPEAVTVDYVVLIAPAVSPDFDLSRALHHVRGKMYVFHSEGDWFILGWGTSTFGTVDCKKCQAAGRSGFVMPQSADAAEYRKLVQIPYNSAWIKYFNFGDHTGAMSPSFARNFLSPLLRQAEHPERGKDVAD
jgi:hypothetical protein